VSPTGRRSIGRATQKPLTDCNKYNNEINKCQCRMRI
jgi:hypothetical protein